jgi:hypothetical protein
MRSALLSLPLLVACTAVPDDGPNTDREADTAEGTEVTDTGTCPDGVALLNVDICFESTAVGLEDDPYAGAYEPVTVTGTVVASGPFVDDTDAVEVEGFQKCGSHGTEREMVRIVDIDGATWTFAWSLEGDAGPRGTGLFVPGETLTFEWMVGDYSGLAVAMRDATGLRYLLDAYPRELPPEMSDGLQVVDGLECTGHDDQWGEIEHVQLVFDGVGIWPGETRTVQGDGGPLEIVVPASGTVVSCVDGCSDATWIGWR